MIRVRFLAYILLSFVFGMAVLYVTWTIAFAQGMVIGRAEYVAWVHDFDIAVKEKSPLFVKVYGVEYQLLPHTDKKEALIKKVRVVKRKEKDELIAQ